jgi:hypothetical protein
VGREILIAKDGKIYPYFDKPLRVEDVVGEDEWLLIDNFTFWVSKSEFYIVPIGFKTDLFTIPWGFRWLIPKDQKGRQAAVLHDHLVTERKVEWRKTVKLFEMALKKLNVNFWRRGLLVNAVFLGGPRWKINAGVTPEAVRKLEDTTGKGSVDTGKIKKE